MIEGAVLYSSFAFLKHFQSEGKNKLMNVTAGINFSVKDENIHSEAGAWLFRTYLRELIEDLGVSDRQLKEIQEDLIDVAKTIEEHEAIIIDKIFENGDIKGITSIQLKEFVKERLNLCLGNLGIISYRFEVEDDYVSSWFYKNINSSKLHDFFAKQGSEYNRAWSESKFTW
jgi:ribonucleotide reductase beta subunit family protein with ferritin-like domain